MKRWLLLAAMAPSLTAGDATVPGEATAPYPTITNLAEDEETQWIRENR